MTDRARLEELRAAARPERLGTVVSVVGLGITVRGIEASIGEIIHIGDHANDFAPLLRPVGDADAAADRAAREIFRGE